MWQRIVLIALVFFHVGLHAQSNADSLRVLDYLKRADGFWNKNLDSLSYYIQQAIALADQLKDQSLQQKTYNVRGLMEEENGQLEAAIDWYERGVSINQVDTTKPGLGVLYFNLSSAYRKMGDYNRALLALEKANVIFQGLEDYNRLAKIKNSLAIIYKAQKDYGTALKYYNEALDAHEVNDDPEGQVNVSINIALIHLARSQPDDAKEYVEGALKLADSVHYVRGIGYAYSVLYDIYLNTFELAEAEVALDSAFQIFERLNIPYRIAGLKLKQGTLSMSRKQFENAIEACSETLVLAEENGFLEIEKSACDCLQRAHFKKGNYQQAYKFQTRLYAVRDSLYNTKIKVSLANLQSKYEAEKSKRLLVQSELELEKTISEKETIVANAERQRKYIWIAVLGCSIAAIVALALWFMYAQKRKTNKHIAAQHEVIEQALKDKEMLLGEIHHRVKNNLQLVKSILDLHARSVNDEPSRMALLESLNRVNAIAVVHHKLYSSESVSELQSEHYLVELVQAVKNLYTVQNTSVNVAVESDNFALNIEKAVPLGLIITELITNSYKHAFPISGGHISVALTHQKGKAVITVADDGVGQAATHEPSFGTLMIKSMVRQLKGELQVIVEQGTKTIINFDLQ